MTKSILINLGSGSLSEGFETIVVQLFDDRGSNLLQVQGSLPPALELVEAYRDWQVLYLALTRRLRRRGKIEVVSGSPTNISEVNLEKLSERLAWQLEEWLSSKSFLLIENKLNAKLNDRDPIRVIIVVDNELVRQLPWHLWHFFLEHPHAEVALSTPQFLMTPRSQTPIGKVRILAIFGDGKDLDLQQDRQFLKKLPKSADLVELTSPDRQQLTEYLWDERGWDILFFAGHSQTEAEKGRIFLNSSESLTIDDLKHALKSAIDRGLQLAIFNSCEGLGLARQLEDLYIPQVVVMKEAVSDRVAHHFLQYFLKQFAGGGSFYDSIRQAREKLQGIEKEFPCASWLPVICQNPTIIAPTWRQLCDRGTYTPLVPVIIGIISTTLILGIRSLGMLQGLELMAYDRSMQMRPDEGTDSHILVVTATQQDIEANGGYPLPDSVIAETIANLNRYQPKSIALDIIRDRPRGTGNSQLIELFQQKNNLIATCSHPEPDNAEKAGFKAPDGAKDGLLGFSDIVVDGDDRSKIIRRHLLSLEPTSTCPTDYALSARLAELYLADKGLKQEIVADDAIKIGKTQFTALSRKFGGYRDLDNAGFQILLNYRSGDKPFATVTLSDVLNNQVSADLIKDRAILIGVTDRTSNSDYHDTPIGENAGVILQAHMTSQIINAALDKRPLIGVWQAWQEGMWILLWAIFYGGLLWRLHQPWQLATATLATVGVLCSSCLFLLIKGWWLPLVPSLLAVLITGTIILLDRVSGLKSKFNIFSSFLQKTKLKQ